jgi:hypothetical protein
LNRKTGITVYAWAAILLYAPSGFVWSAPLFDDQQTLDVILEAPIQALSRQRHKNPEFAGTFRYTDTSGREHSFAVSVSTRGKSRLEVCDYPPLKITFDPRETAGTLFEGQRNLKLVRQCKRGKASRDWVYLELGVYRAYSVITDYSFTSRQLNVTFRDTESGNREYVQPGFFLEDDKRLAKRVNRQRIRPPKVEFGQMAAVATTHKLLFQFLIGNTDFAVKRGPSGEGCCHNGRVIAEDGKHDDWIVVPYDFDYAGIINANYAAPAEALPISRVTTRLYRGFCWQNETLPDSIELFNRKRGEIEAALIPTEVSQRKSRKVRRYLDRFYEIVNDGQELKKQILDKCRGPGSLPIRESPVSPGYIKATAGSRS